MPVLAKAPEKVVEVKKIVKRNYSTYYDTPEGKDIPTKVMVTARYGIIAGLIAGTYDILMFSHTVGFSKILGRYAMHVVPLGMMGAVFTVVANTLVGVRGVNDKLNYFLGGVACGPILASYLGTKQAIVPGALFLGAVAVIKKTGLEYNHSFFPEIHPHMGVANSWRHDFTLSRDPLDDCTPEICGPPKKK